MARMGLIDGGADHLGALESMREFRPARLQPGDQLGDRAHAARNVDVFGGDAGLLFDPSKVEETHQSSSDITWRNVAFR